ncbi:IS3 family transposase [Furfurilactobacillus rossiae]
MSEQTNPRTHKPYVIEQLCALTGIKRAAYYKWTHRKPNQRELDNEVIWQFIEEREARDYGIYGSQRMTRLINRETEFHVNRKRVYRLMDAHGMTASIRKAKVDRKSQKAEVITANILDRKFSANEPNQRWVTDCTELQYGIDTLNKVKLSAIKDLYDHSIIAYNLSDTETAAAVTITLHRALETCPDAEPLLHTDRGSAYTARIYDLELRQHHITHSMSRGGKPIDNGAMETFWSHIKDEWFDLRPAGTFKELVALVDAGIDWYNNGRPQETLNGLTPNEYRNQTVRKTS